jgi:hypothetical protein
MSSDTFQLDALNAAGVYERVDVGDRYELESVRDFLKLKAWRIWNRTTRAKRDRLLPPVSCIINTTSRNRWAKAHLPARGTSANFQQWGNNYETE